jgi:serine/threonine-protein kinase
MPCRSTLLAGRSVKVLDDVSSFNLAASGGFDVAESGALVYVPGSEGAPDRVPEGDVVWVDRGGRVSPLAEQRNRYASVAVSPDGRRVAATIAEHPGEGELWVYDIAQRAWTRMTTAQFVWGPLVWSPDGQTILFTSFAPGEGDLFRIPVAGGVAERLTSDDATWEYPTSVTPDGATVMISAAGLGQMDIRTLGLARPGAPQPFVTTPSFFKSNAAISPDGRWVAYQSEEHGRREIFVTPLTGPGESRRVSPAGGTNPAWRHDGRELVYQRETEIWSVAIEPGAPFRAGTPRLLFESAVLDGAYRDTLMFSPVHDRFVAVRRAARKPTERQLVFVPNWLDTVARTVRPAR